MPTPIVIAGMPGSGKTTVGRALADELEATFVDLDLRVERLSGRTVPELFAEGEPRFREWERRAVASLLKEPLSAAAGGVVVACGGGTLSNGRCGEMLAQYGRVVVLDCGLSVLRERVGNGTRPLLAKDSSEVIAELWERRRADFAAVPWHVDGTEPVERVVQAIRRSATRDSAPPLAAVGEGAASLEVPTPSGSYPVMIESGGLRRVGELARARAPAAHRVALVSDAHVLSLYGDRTREALEKHGFRVSTLQVPRGEAAKTVAVWEGLVRQIVDTGMTRDDLVLCLGGGAVGDVGGFAAATCLRGIQSLLVPTTSLAMVDASVGGKVAVNLPRGKNLVGAFHMPSAVLVDPRLLRTLDEPDLRAGAAEMLKHGLLADPGHFEALEGGGLPSTEDDAAWVAVLARSIAIKADVVASDPFERQGRRVGLNLGHTIGHALEAEYGLRHGVAVGLGLIAMARLSAGLVDGDPSLEGRIVHALRQVRLPHTLDDFLADTRWAERLGVDKKRGGAQLRLVLLRSIARPELCVADPARIVSLLRPPGGGC